jgi:hypothetical protein
MSFTIRCGLARVTCFVVCFACASGFGTARDINSATELGGDGAVTLPRRNTDEGVPYNLLHQTQELSLFVCIVEEFLCKHHRHCCWESGSAPRERLPDCLGQ